MEERDNSKEVINGREGIREEGRKRFFGRSEIGEGEKWKGERRRKG